MKTIIQWLKAYLLFGTQIVMACWFIFPLVIKPFHSTEGMSITWTMFGDLFVTVNLVLALSQYQTSRSRDDLRVVIVYIVWIVVWSAGLVSIIINGSWLEKDTIVTVAILVGVLILLGVRWNGSLRATTTEPLTRGFVALLLKSTPQIYLAYCIMSARSHGGLHWQTLLIGHITVITRWIEIALAAKKNGLNRKNLGMIISESGNELSWLAVTWAWFKF